MGTASCKFSDKFAKKYDFIQFTRDQNLGPIKIYRKKQPFYDYLMVIEKIINEQQLKAYQGQLDQIDRSYKGQNESMLLRIYGREIIKDTLSSCNKKVRLKLYIEYLNYTLKDLIRHRKQHNRKFTLEEINFIINCSLETYRFYQQINAPNISFLSTKIFITPEGQLRFSPLAIFPERVESLNSQQCIEMNCIQPIKFKKSFRMKDKLMVYEIKKLINQLTQGIMLQDKNLFLLKKHLNNTKSIADISQIIYKPSIQKLDFNPKNVSKSEEETTKVCKNSPAITNSQFSHSSKISVKNYVNQGKKQNRPYSYQQHYP